MHQNESKTSGTSENSATNPSSYLLYNGYTGDQSWNNYGGYGYGLGAYEERGSWRKLYDYQSGFWYYENLLTSTTQWEEPDGWVAKSQSEEIDTPASKFRRAGEEIEKKNAEYMKRPARRQVDPEEAKKVHWRPEGANEYNIWYDKYIGDHWSQSKNDGRRLDIHTARSTAIAKSTWKLDASVCV